MCVNIQSHTIKLVHFMYLLCVYIYTLIRIFNSIRNFSEKSSMMWLKSLQYNAQSEKVESYTNGNYNHTSH